ncbi:hypothetical protein ACWDAZ_36405, partial [Streptomyces sp. NPDC001215]
LLEGGLPARFLPRDIGIGRPGLQARLDAVESVPHLATTVVTVRRPEADAAVLRLLKPLPRGNSG